MTENLPEITDDIIEFTDVNKFGCAPVRSCEELFKHEYDRLEKGKYDIDYVINLLKIILDQIEKNKFSGSNFSFTMSESLKRLLALILVEKNQMK